jgi:hypothetical protein|nr:MAG TPA: hypothetical protein [Caudoviricetes sp.]
MAAQVVTARELIEYLTDIIEKHGDIPAVIDREEHGAVESVGRPAVVPVIPAGTVGGFQAYDYARRQDAQIKAALIN